MSTPPIDPASVELRDLTENEIPLILDYWFRSPPGFVESMGVDLTKLASEENMEKVLREKYRANAALPVSKATALVIFVDGKPVGVHTLFPLFEGDHAVFHAHIFKSEMRKRGLGRVSYPKACRIFIERFGLKRIVFKTPLQNTGALQVKEKLGIRCIGEEEIVFGIIRNGTKARVYELTREEAESL